MKLKIGDYVMLPSGAIGFVLSIDEFNLVSIQLGNHPSGVVTRSINDLQIVELTFKGWAE